MSSKISRIICLMKKAYDQPLLFHKLHSHLINVLKLTQPTYELDDDWSKMIIFSASPNKMPNQGIELKIQKLIKNIKSPFDDDNSKLKFIVICYYLMNRPVRLINHIVLFELISNFIGIDEYCDTLIISILKRVCIAEISGDDKCLKLTDDALKRMLQIVSNSDLSYSNAVLALPCFTIFNIKPNIPQFAGLTTNLQCFKFFENLVFYIKYACTKNYIENNMPEHPDFIKGVEMILGNDFILDDIDIPSNNNLLMQDKQIYNYLKRSYNKATNKDQFIDSITNYLYNLRDK